MRLFRVLGLALVLALTLAACPSKGGKAGDKCRIPGDCARGYFCDETCQAGPETSCAYLARCIPKMELDQVQTLFGDDAQELVNSLEENPQENYCEGKLRILKMANRIVILNRACGPQIVKGP